MLFLVPVSGIVTPLAAVRVVRACVLLPLTDVVVTVGGLGVLLDMVGAVVVR